MVCTMGMPTDRTGAEPRPARPGAGDHRQPSNTPRRRRPRGTPLADDHALMESLGEVPFTVVEKANNCGGHNLSWAEMIPGPWEELIPDLSR